MSSAYNDKVYLEIISLCAQASYTVCKAKKTEDISLLSAAWHNILFGKDPLRSNSIYSQILSLNLWRMSFALIAGLSYFYGRIFPRDLILDYTSAVFYVPKETQSGQRLNFEHPLHKYTNDAVCFLREENTQLSTRPWLH